MGKKKKKVKKPCPEIFLCLIRHCEQREHESIISGILINNNTVYTICTLQDDVNGEVWCFLIISFSLDFFFFFPFQLTERNMRAVHNRPH